MTALATTNGAGPPAGFYEAHDDAVEERIVSDFANSRMSPCDLRAEAAVLSASLVDARALDTAATILTPEKFCSEAHRWIFQATLALRANGNPIDAVQVASWLREHGRLAQVGGLAYLTEIPNAAPVAANVEAYARTVRDEWRRRELILIAHRLTARGYARDCATDALIARGAEQIAALTSSSETTTILTAPEIAAPLPDLEYLVREIGLVAGGGAPHLLAGYGFSGKTVAAQSMALSLAADVPIWGVYRTRKRSVLHVDLEQGERLTLRRYQRLALAMGVNLAGLGDGLAVAVMPPLTLTIADGARWRELMTGRDLIIIDSLRAAMPGADENDSSIRSGLDMLGHISEQTGCRPLVIHHARKSGADDVGGRYAIRGSSAIFDGCDSAYLFSAEQGEPVRVQHVKARSHGEPVPDWALLISDANVAGDPRAGLTVRVHGIELVTERRESRIADTARARAGKDAERVRRALAKTPGLSTTELRATTCLSGDRMALATAHLGEGVEIREERRGQTRVNRHYLRGPQ
jgi:hypothetical protein